MQSKATNVEQYLNELPEDRIVPMVTLRDTINAHIPTGFEERMSYGMIGWVVPHSLYPAGYHCTPKDPLPFLNIASQKNFIAVYHMCVYANKELSDWFTSEYTKFSKAKLDMGKSCIRFKKPEHIPYALIGELASKITVAQWIEMYESAFRR
ncbi:MAG: DUF1801 domain-containing protein [Saprospiraceae bacterium]|nr:DUF1801 domain-containing protein [Saprospiraceae bacterium]